MPGSRDVAAGETVVGRERLGDAVARERDPARPGRTHGQGFHARMQMAPVPDQAERDALVQEQGGDGPGLARLERRHRVPEVRGEARAGLDRGARGRRVGERMADSRDRPLGHDAGSRHGRNRAPGAMVTRRTSPRSSHSARRSRSTGRRSSDREGACGLGVQERPLEVQPEAERVGRLNGLLRGLKIARHPCSDQGFRRVDM